VTTDRLPPALAWAVEAARNKKALGITVLDLAQLGAFTDAFLLCTGTSVRQAQAIGREIEEQLEGRGLRCRQREGSDTSEWVLLDYRDFIVHVFTERARVFYDLERLWRSARRVDLPDEPAAEAAQP
jgi:ribosome-associated protein